MHLWLFIFHHPSSTPSSQPASLYLLTNGRSPLLLPPVPISMDAIQASLMKGAQSARMIHNLSVPQCLSLSDCVITHHSLIADAGRTDGRSACCWHSCCLSPIDPSRYFFIAGYTLVSTHSFRQYIQQSCPTSTLTL